MKLLMSVLFLIGVSVIVGTSAINAADPCYFGHYEYSNYTATTGTFTVTGNTYIQTSVFSIPDNNTQITRLVVNASSNSDLPPLPLISSPSRNFVVYFSGGTTSSYFQSLTGLQAPWITNSGTTVRSLGWDVTDTGFDVAGSGRIRVSGAGSTSTWATNQRTLVSVSIFGTKRTWVPCDATETSTSTLEAKTTTTSSIPVVTTTSPDVSILSSTTTTDVPAPTSTLTVSTTSSISPLSTTSASVVNDVVTTTSSSNPVTQASLPVALVVGNSLSIGKVKSVKLLATSSGLQVPTGSRLSVKVLNTSQNFCKVINSSLRGLKVGTCRATVTVTPKKGRATSKTVTLKVTK